MAVLNPYLGTRGLLMTLCIEMSAYAIDPTQVIGSVFDQKNKTVNQDIQLNSIMILNYSFITPILRIIDAPKG